jgi:predicted ATPase
VLDAAPLVSDVLVACPSVRILVTSRTLLRIDGEHVYPVHPLVLPLGNSDDSMTPELAIQSPAVALFLARAQSVQPSFALTADNVRSVVDVCRELDGLPLALELAAARIALLPPVELLRRLLIKPGHSVLSTGRRDAPARHRALRDAIAWSHDLLSVEQQRLYRVPESPAVRADRDVARCVVGCRAQDRATGLVVGRTGSGRDARSSPGCLR